MIWTLLSLYLLFLLFFNLPSVQAYMGRKVAGVLAQKLGTSVAIGRIEYSIPSHLTLHQVNIKDQAGQDMLTAGRLSARLDLLPLAEGKISLSTAQLFSMHARMYQRDADSQPNFQFVLDSLASKDTTSTSPLNLRINSLIVRHSSVTFDRQDVPEVAGQLTADHLHLKDISSHIALKALSEDSLNINVKRLSFQEQSGLKVDRLTFHFEGGRHGLRVEDFLLRLPGTNIELGDLAATYRFRGDHFVTPSLKFHGSIKPSTVTLSDASCLLPTLHTFQSTLSVAADFQGQGEDIQVNKLTVQSTAGDIGIDINGTIRGLRQPQPAWTTNINDLALSGKTVSFISENLKGQRMQVPEALLRLGNIHLTGNASGKGDSEVQTRCQLSTDAGNAALTFTLDSLRRFCGQVDTKGIDLKRVLANNHLGQLATAIKLSGRLPRNAAPTIQADGSIQQLVYNGYQYQNIEVNGRYHADDINGKVTIDDPNLSLILDGNVTKSGKQHRIDLAAVIANFSPQNTNLSGKWKDARFFADIKANFLASGVNDADGTIDITDFLMSSPTESYEMERLHVESGYNDDLHYMVLQTDFGEAQITGDFNFSTVPQSFVNFIAAKLPTLPGLPAVSADTHNDFAIQATIRKSDWLERLLQIPLRLSQPLTLRGTLNDNLQQVALECNIPQFHYANSRYENGHVSLLSPLNTLHLDAGITKVSAAGEHLDIQLTNSAINNMLTTSVTWDNHAEERMSGHITGRTEFEELENGHQVTHVSIAPSKVKIRNADWDIHPCHIAYSDKHLDIDNFTIRHDDQHLTLNGTASESSLDSILVSMRDIEVGYVLDLVDFDAVDFDGYATGSGVLRGIFGDFQADGLLTVSQFTFEHGRMGTLHAQVDWNSEQQQIDIKALSDDGPDAITHINGYVSPARNFIDLDIKAEGTHLDFAQSFTSSFISSVTGNADGEIRLAGPLDAINLTGNLVLNGRAHVSTLNCVYEMRNDSLRLVPNEIEFVHCPIYDRYGNMGMLTGGIHHQELTNLTFDIFVQARNLLAYDFRNFGNDTFYGTVYANGNVAIRGRSNSVTIEADVTPQRGTVFVYNAASPDAITDQNFIEWNVKNEGVQSRSALASENAGDQQAVVSPLDRTDINMRLKINANPNATVRLLMDERTQDYITLRGNGELQTSFYNKGGFNMFGTYRVTEGTYGLTIQNIIRKNFTFKEGGTIVFSGDPYNANLNLQAQHTVNGVSLSDLNVGRSFSNTVRVNCLMNISGQPRQPIVDFDFEMPNVNADEQQMVRSIINSEEEMNQQVIYLLAVGRFYPQGTNNDASEEGAEGQSKTSLAMQSLLSGTLSGQINNVLGQVIQSNNWNFGANISTGDEGWNNAEYEGLVSGRLLNNRLLINGQFGYRDNSTTATPSFIGDFDIRYLLYPNGNLALKVYNQSNDRYFTKSSLNTQGLGIIMKKDFDSLNDLLGIKRKLKVNKDRVNGEKTRSEKTKSKGQE